MQIAPLPCDLCVLCGEFLDRKNKLDFFTASDMRQVLVTSYRFGNLFPPLGI
jgi:hypothetical protein